MDLEHWAQALLAQIRERRDELAALAPWLPLFGGPRNRTIRRPGPSDAKGCWKPFAES